MSKVTKWTEESIQKVAGTYKNKSEFRKGNSNAYRAAGRRGIVDSLKYDVKSEIVEPKVKSTEPVKKVRKKRAPMSQEMKDRISAKVKATCAARSLEQKQAFSQKVKNGINKLTPEQRAARNAKIKAAAASKTPDEKKVIASKISHTLKSKSQDEKERIASKVKATRAKNNAEMMSVANKVIK